VTAAVRDNIRFMTCEAAALQSCVSLPDRKGLFDSDSVHGRCLCDVVHIKSKCSILGVTDLTDACMRCSSAWHYLTGRCSTFFWPAYMCTRPGCLLPAFMCSTWRSFTHLGHLSGRHFGGKDRGTRRANQRMPWVVGWTQVYCTEVTGCNSCCSAVDSWIELGWPARGLR
jgi:hypothetical protein